MIHAILFLTSFVLTYFIKNYAIKKSFVATVNGRSSHTIPTPHGGGIAIVITWFGGLIYFYLENQIDSQLFVALMVGLIISLVSFFDDIYELSPKVRLMAQASVALFGLVSLGGLEVINLGVFEITNIFVTNIVAFVAIIWFINLYNFLDGINGYAGSEAVFLGLAGFVLFGGEHFLVLAMAVLGFLYWNWNRAKIFMGDVGSTLLGYNIAIFTIYYTNQESANLWIWLALFGLFWFDATITLIRRKLNGEKLSLAHRKHAYQRLTQSGWSHYKVTNYSIGVNIVLFLIVYLIANIFVAMILSLIVLMICMNVIDSKKRFE